MVIFLHINQSCLIRQCEHCHWQQMLFSPELPLDSYTPLSTPHPPTTHIHTHTHTDLYGSLALHEITDLAENALTELDPWDGSVFPHQERWPKPGNPRKWGYFGKRKTNTQQSRALALLTGFSQLDKSWAQNTIQNCPSETPLWMETWQCKEVAGKPSSPEKEQTKRTQDPEESQAEISPVDTSMALCIRNILATGNAFHIPIPWARSSELVVSRLPAVNSSSALGASGQTTELWLLSGPTCKAVWRSNGVRMCYCWINFAKIQHKYELVHLDGQGHWASTVE